MRVRNSSTLIISLSAGERARDVNSRRESGAGRGEGEGERTSGIALARLLESLVSLLLELLELALGVCLLVVERREGGEGRGVELEGRGRRARGWWGRCVGRVGCAACHGGSSLAVEREDDERERANRPHLLSCSSTPLIARHGRTSCFDSHGLSSDLSLIRTRSRRTSPTG